MKFVYGIFIVLALAILGIANVYGQQLSQTEKEALQRRTKEKVEEFQFYMGHLGDRNADEKMKDHAYKTALKLFIGECESYSVYDFNLDREIQKSAVKMNTSSKVHAIKSCKLMKKYLSNLRNLSINSKVEIINADIVRVDNIYQVDDHYEGMAYFCQKYIGYRDGCVAYSDITTNKVRIYINAIQIPNEDGMPQTVWNHILLGDVYAIETN